MLCNTKRKSIKERKEDVVTVKVKIADVVFGLLNPSVYVLKICENYLVDESLPSEFDVKISKDDIEFERSHAEVKDYPEPYLESLAIFRKICAYILSEKDGILFHSSAVAVDGKAYLFTGVSGSGKSTHANLWKEMLGDKMQYVNDDKPIIRLIDGKFYVYGTPWMGKHFRGNNVKAEVKAICKIVQGKVNKIERLSVPDTLAVIFNQTVRPSDSGDMIKLLDILDKFIKSVDSYVLTCDISREACELSYNAMAKGELK